MAKWGGKQEGAGRPKGGKNKKTLERLALLESTGITPLEVMINNMRWAYGQVELLEIDYDPSDEAKRNNMGQARDKAHGYAESAVNYYHPKLASVAHTGPDGDGPIQTRITVTFVDDAEGEK